MPHIDGTICPPGTRPISKDLCSGCKFYTKATGCANPNLPCTSGTRPDGFDGIFAEGAMSRLVLLRKVEGGYADIEPPPLAQSVRAYYCDGRRVKQSPWKDVHSLIWPVEGAIDFCAYEFSSKPAEELNRE